MSEVNKIRVLGKDYLIKTRRRVGINQVTNLSGIPVDREKIIATLSGAADFSFSEPLEPGDLLEIICTANEGTEEFVQDFTGPGITTNFDDLTMISPGKVVIAKIYCYEEGKYFIVGEGTEKAVFKYNTGDIIVYDNKVKRLIPISPEVHNFLDYPTSRYAPVGVVVIPNSHNVYGNGAAGIVSLTPMSTLTPSTGASDGNDIEEMCWGELSDIETLPDLSQVNHLGNTSEIKNSVQGTTNTTGCMAIDYSVGGIQNPLDTQTIYLQANEYHAPSPYDNYGNRSPLYYQTSSPGSIYNSLSDFHGYANTKEIVKVRGDKNYGSWKPTKMVGSDYPAASCCDMYFTEGTKQGDWYLPGFGELGYLVARKKVIDSSLVKLGKYSINVEKNILSSTEVRGDYSSIVDAVNGKFGYTEKTNTGHVYSFLQLSGDGKVMDPNSLGNISTMLFINDINADIEISEDGVNFKKYQGNNIILSNVGKKLYYKFYKTGYESQEGVMLVDSSLKYIKISLNPILYSISFNITPSDAQITYSIDSKTYENTYVSGEKIGVYYESTIYYRLVREGYYNKENFLKVTGDATISESMDSSDYKYEFDVSESDMNFTSEGGTKSVTVVSRKLTFSGDIVSNISYSRNNSDVFIEGQNNTITVSKNVYTYSRSGYVEFIQEESGNRKTVNISQESGGKYVTITTKVVPVPMQRVTLVEVSLSEAADTDINISVTIVSNGSDVNTVNVPINAGRTANAVTGFHNPVDGEGRVTSVTPSKSDTQIYTW